MKTLKLAVVALSLGFFAASCGNSDTTNETPVDSTTMTTPPEAAPETTAPVVDSPAAPMVDTPAATPATK